MKIKQFVREIFAQVKRDWRMPVTEHQIYDTTERVIGTYMGKPLYRTVYRYNPNIPLNTAGWRDLQDISSLNAEHCNVTVFGQYYSTYGELSSLAALQYGVTNGVVQVFVTNTDSLSVSYIILEYTKTTDTATESKVPFEPLTEYSTEERMIGYWIDGKPLYRKVVAISAQTADSATYEYADYLVSEAVVRKISAVNNQGVPSGYYYSSSNKLSVNGANSAGHFVVEAPAQRNNFPLFVTLEYTKTTD